MGIKIPANGSSCVYREILCTLAGSYIQIQHIRSYSIAMQRYNFIFILANFLLKK